MKALRDKFKILIMIILVGILGVNISQEISYAAGELITSIETDKDESKQGDSVKVTVNFGGANVNVTEGQTETINFNLNNTKITLPQSPIELKDKNGNSIGVVEFDDNKAILTFNSHAATLNDIEGQFYFNVFTYWNGDENTDGKGTIQIESGNIKKDVTFVYETGGVVTDNIFSKLGVWDPQHKDGNRVDWIFDINAAKKSVNSNDVTFEVTDKLPDSMNWDKDFINTNPYIMELNGKWYSLAEANNIGIKINISDKDLAILIPSYINIDGWIRPLDQRNIKIRLTAIVTDEVMGDKTIEYVTNKAETTIKGIDWDVKAEDKEDSVKIIRSGGWASGTRPGELKILKLLSSNNAPISDIEFTLTKSDGSDIYLREGGVNVNKGKSIILTTDQNGEARIKGLSIGSYTLKETKAPERVNMDPESKTFDVTSEDTEGIEFTIINNKKIIDVEVKKIWKNLSQDMKDSDYDIKVQLYRNNEPLYEAIDLNKDKLTYKWEELDAYDDNGEQYLYQVKELNDESSAIEDGDLSIIGDNSYIVKYQGDQKEGFKITNTQQPHEAKPEYKDIEGEKIRKEDIENERPQSITINLINEETNEIVSKTTATKKTDWKYKFTKVLIKDTTGKAYDYRLEEEVPEGYEVKYEGTTIINTKKPDLPKPEPKYVDIEGIKKWVGDTEEDRPTSITIKLIDKQTGKVISSTKTTKESDWKYKFTKVLVKDTAGKAYDYRLEEEVPEGYEVKYDGTTIINTKKPDLPQPESKYVDIEGIKKWVGDKEEDRPTSITIKLIDKQTGKVISSTKVTKESDWKYKFTKVLVKDTTGKAYDYRLEEEVPEGYEVKYDGTTIINTKKPDLPQPESKYVDIEGIKKWVGDKEEDRPTSITIKLIDKQTGKVVNSTKATKESGWKYKFTNILAKDSQGRLPEYRIEEVVPAGYTVKYEGTTIINTLKENKQNLPNKPERENKPNKPNKPERENKPNNTENNNTKETKPNTKSLPQTGDGISRVLIGGAIFIIGIISAIFGYKFKKMQNS